MQDYTFLLFHFIGYGKKDGEQLVDRVDISLIDTSYDNALRRARGIVKKEFWFLAEVTEFMRKDCE